MAVNEPIPRAQAKGEVCLRSHNPWQPVISPV